MRSGILEENEALTKEEARQLIIIEEDDDNSIFNLLDRVKCLDDDSIIAACKIATYDVWFRNINGAVMAKGARDTNPDKETINNIRVMIQRSLSFWEKVGPIVADGFVFSERDDKGDIVKSGYTSTVDAGDGTIFQTTQCGILRSPNRKLKIYIHCKYLCIILWANIQKWISTKILVSLDSLILD